MGNIFSCCWSAPSRTLSPEPEPIWRPITPQYHATSSPVSHYEYDRQLADVVQQGYQSRNKVSSYPTAREYTSERVSEDVEHQRRIAEIRAKSEERRKQMLQQFDDDSRADSSKRRRQQEEQNQRTNDMINAARYENFRRDQDMNLETEREIQRILDAGKFDYEDYDRQMSDIRARAHESDARFNTNSYRFQQEDLERERETQRAREEQNERRQRIDEDFARKLEQMQREAERKQNDRNRQMDEMRELMKKAVWTAVIERNWTNRLNALRNANQDCKRLEFRCLRSNATSSDIEEWKETIKILQEVMRNESSNMTKMYSNTGKSFLLEIKSAVDLVARNCEVLLRGLPSETSGSGQLSQLARELDMSCSAIPTLAELKRNYIAEMRSNSNL